MTIKHCEDVHGGGECDCERRQILRRLLAAAAALLLIASLTVLLVFLILRPTKPSFYLEDASVLNLTLSSPTLLTSSLQITIASRNPNSRIGVFYDRLDVYAVYKYQQITLSSSLSPVYQGHLDVDVWSPFLSANAVPVSPFLAAALRQDCASGFLLIEVKGYGRIRWKVGSWISGHYHLVLSCSAIIATAGDSGGIDGEGGSSSYRFQQLVACSVDV